MSREPRSGPPGRELADRLPALLDPRGLAAQRPQVVQLGAADLARGHAFDRRDRRGVKRECALHADAVADLPHGEGLARTAALPADDYALEHLDPGAVALGNPDVHPQGVTRPERLDVRSDLRLLKLGNRGVHRLVVLVLITRTATNALQLVWAAAKASPPPPPPPPPAAHSPSLSHIFPHHSATSLG